MVADGCDGGSRCSPHHALGREQKGLTQLLREDFKQIWFSPLLWPAGVSSASAQRQCTAPVHSFCSQGWGDRRGMWGAPPAGPCTPASVTLPSSRPTLSKCHPPQPQQSPSPFLFLCSCSRGRTSGLSISAMFWALLAGHPRLAVTRGVPMHIAAPLAEPVLTPNSCADRSPATREQLLLKLQPGQKQEPALAKHQLGARNSPGTHTCHLLSTNFTARGIQSMAAQLCHGQRGKSHFLAPIQQWLLCLVWFQVLSPGCQGSPVFLVEDTASPQIWGPSKLHSVCRALSCQDPPGATTVLCHGHRGQPGSIPRRGDTEHRGVWPQGSCQVFQPPPALGEPQPVP